MTDTITITDLELWTRIGVPDEERATEQRVLVSISIELDTTEAAKNDDVSKSIDYAQLANAIVDLAKQERKTIEKLADDISVYITSNEQRATNHQVTITKFPLPNTKNVSITIRR